MHKGGKVRSGRKCIKKISRGDCMCKSEQKQPDARTDHWENITIALLRSISVSLERLSGEGGN